MDVLMIKLFLWGIILLFSAQTSCSQSCPIFGTDQGELDSFSDKERIFLNYESPSQCNGTVTSWQYCYYPNAGRRDSNTQEYAAKLLVYRRLTNSNIYQPVPNSTVLVSIMKQNLTSGAFECRTVSLGASEQFQIQENDIIAACIIDDRPYKPLRLVGDRSGGNEVVYQYNANRYEDCTNTQLQTVDTDNNAFTTRSGGRHLHLYVNVERLTTSVCSAGHNPPPFTSSTTSGTYLNTLSPIQCTGTITAWHYCYYPPNTGTTTLSADVGVWRLDRVLSRYELVAGSNYTFQLLPESSHAKIVCKNVPLQEGQYIGVNQNDIIGITIPTMNPIPLIASVATGYSLQRSTQTSPPTTLATSELTELSNMALHLYPDIGSSIALPTTVSRVTPMTTFGTRNSPTTISRSDSTTPVPMPLLTTSELLITPTTTLGTAAAVTTLTNTNSSTSTLGNTMPSFISKLNMETSTSAATSSTIPMTSVGSNMSQTSTEDPSATDSDSNMTPSSTTTTTTQETTLSNIEEQHSGLSSGALVGIIIGILTTLTVISIVVGITICKTRSSRHPPKKIKKDNLAFQNMVYDVAEREENEEYEDICMNSLYDEVDSKEDFAKTSSATYDVPICLTYDIPAPATTYDVPQIAAKNVGEENYIAEGRQGNTYSLLQKVKEKEVAELKEQNLYYSPADEESAIYEQLDTQGITIIRTKDIKITGELGSGQFGTVEKGIMKPENVEVAVKSLKCDASNLDRVKFLQEAAIMAQFKHPNVVTLHGVVRDGNTVLIVVELLHKGDLLEHLLSLRPVGQTLSSSLPEVLLSYSQQIAIGMVYLSNKGFVHRDLAARNVLVSECKVCKIADFGMSRDLAQSDYYVSHGGKVPIKWTAPEAINYKKYSTSSDVWSFGCLLYEIWSLGHKPFEGKSNMEVITLVDLGKRLPPPPGCPKVVYKIMMQCWNPTASDRPTFRDILLELLNNEATVLHIPNEDRLTCEQAGVLGSPLEAGEDMYSDLQDTYQTELTCIL